MLELDELWSFVGNKARTCWLWVALCRRTCQIVASTLGDRSQESAFWLWESIPEDYRSRETRSDLWLAYEAAFTRLTHRFWDKQEGETNHAERWFGSLRQRLGCFVRKTLSFSKSERMHELALRLFIYEYNQQPIL